MLKLCFVGTTADVLCKSSETSKERFNAFVQTLASNLKKLCSKQGPIQVITNGEPGLGQIAFWAANRAKLSGAKITTELHCTEDIACYLRNSASELYKDSIFHSLNAMKMIDLCDKFSIKTKDKRDVISESDATVIIRYYGDCATEYGADASQHSDCIIHIDLDFAECGLVPVKMDVCYDRTKEDDAKRNLRSIFRLENFVAYDVDEDSAPQTDTYESETDDKTLSSGNTDENPTKMIITACKTMSFSNTSRYNSLFRDAAVAKLESGSPFFGLEDIEIDIIHHILITNEMFNYDKYMRENIYPTHRLYARSAAYPDKEPSNDIYVVKKLFDCVYIVEELRANAVFSNLLAKNIDFTAKVFVSNNANFSSKRFAAFYVKTENKRDCIQALINAYPKDND